MSIFCLSTMLIKPKELEHSLHDVDEKKGSYECLDSGLGIRDSGTSPPPVASLAARFTTLRRATMPATRPWLLARSGPNLALNFACVHRPALRIIHPFRNPASGMIMKG